MEDSITRIFCDVHDFCKVYIDYFNNYSFPPGSMKMEAFPNSSLDLSEVMTITVLFHLSGYRCFKWFYKKHVCVNMNSYFHDLVSYNRFVELMPYTLLPLLIYSLRYKVGKCTGISFIDSTKLHVCHNRRIHSHKVFAGLAERGKSSTGWFYGFKLHLVINDRGELLAFCFTPGNVDDRDEGVIDSLCKKLSGRLFGDKGYISQELFEKLYERSITLVTGVRKNMKNKLMVMEDKLLLRKRALIETVNDFLKNICQIEHTRHRSPVNCLVNLLAGLAAYSFITKKPSLHHREEYLFDDIFT